MDVLGGSIVVILLSVLYMSTALMGTTFQSSTTFSNLAPGTYTVTVHVTMVHHVLPQKQDVVNAANMWQMFITMQNGVTDNTVNGAGTNAGTTLYAILATTTPPVRWWIVQWYCRMALTPRMPLPATITLYTRVQR